MIKTSLLFMTVFFLILTMQNCAKPEGVGESQVQGGTSTEADAEDSLSVEPRYFDAAEDGIDGGDFGGANNEEGVSSPMTTLSVKASNKICNQGKINEVLGGGTARVYLDCNLTLPKAYSISRYLVVAGEEASGITIDLGGSTVGTPGRPGLVQIVSKEVTINGKKGWSRPRDVTIKNGILHGWAAVSYSDDFYSPFNMDERIHLSRLSDFVKVMQTRSPYNITFENMSFHGVGKTIPMFIYSGVMGTRILRSRFLGSGSMAIYLEAESGRTLIKDNMFDFLPTRELIGVDATSDNWIVGNIFKQAPKGAVNFYRNCGEGGVVRHTPPQGNIVLNNLFLNPENTGFFVGSRQGLSSYCNQDNDASLGSGISDLDFARFNLFADNRFLDRDVRIRIQDIYNVYINNVTTRVFNRVNSSCFVKDGVPKSLLSHGEMVKAFSRENKVYCTGTEYGCRDGELTVKKAACPMKTIGTIREVFCGAKNSTSGCIKKVVLSCPTGKSLKAVKATCHLRDDFAKIPHLDLVPWGFLQIGNTSKEGGRCAVGGTTLMHTTQSAKTLPLSAMNGSITLACKGGAASQKGSCQVRVRYACL